MKKAILMLSILFLILFPSSVSTQDWDSWDKGLFISLITIHGIDILQTCYIFDDLFYYEKNKIIVKGVDRMGKLFIPVYFLGLSSIEYLIADNLPSPYRKGLLVSFNISHFSTIKGNHDIGIKFGFIF